MPTAAPVLLVVEDEAPVRSVLQGLLQKVGYTVETAADGRAALKRLEGGGIDLVLLDLMLPKLDGYEVCRRVRRDEATRHLPVLMLTALGSDREQLAGFDAGADDYVTKPFRTQELLARVERLLARSGRRHGRAG